MGPMTPLRAATSTSKRVLGGRERAAVLMHKYHEMDYAQIAIALDCSESAVKSLLFRAYESLRGRLAHMAVRART